MVSPEVELWISVVVLAVRDALNGDAVAQRWLANQSPDMRQTCELAGSDAGTVHRAALRLGAIRVECDGLHRGPAPDIAVLSACLLQRLARLSCPVLEMERRHADRSFADR